MTTWVMLLLFPQAQVLDLPVATSNPYTAGADLEQGKRLYGGRCAGCHGPAGNGGKGANLATPSLSRAQTDIGLYTVIRYGLLETEMPPSLGVEQYGTVLVFNYLHRPLMPAIVAAVEPGGVLIYETFTTGQAARGRPTSPAHLLRDGELPAIVAPLVVRRAREGDIDGALISSIVAERR